MNTFDMAVALVLKNEGGYVNDPDDPGGETNFGISKASYPALDIKNLTQAQAIAIYQRDFWDRYGMSRVPATIAPKLFDAIVNMGYSAAVRCLQQALRAMGWAVTVDGDMGVQTLNAVGQCTGCGASALYAAFKSEVAGQYRVLVAQDQSKARFLNGWLNRAYQ